jgi:hypothetical protein
MSADDMIKAIKGELLSVELPLAPDELAPAEGLTPFALGQLGAEKLAVVTEEETRIALDLNEIGRRIVSVGQRLLRVQAVLKDERAFVHWLQTRRTFALSKSSAYRYMEVARTFPNLGNEELAHIDRSALYTLASRSIPPEIRAHALSRAASGERVTHKQVQSDIQAWRHGPRVDPKDVVPAELRRRMEVPPEVSEAELLRMELNSAIGFFRSLVMKRRLPREMADAIDPETKELMIADLSRIRDWINDLLAAVETLEWRGTSSEPLVDEMIARKEAGRLLRNQRQREARKFRKELVTRVSRE